MALLVAVLVVIGDILVEVLERTPRVKVVPKVVKLLDELLGAVDVAKGRNGVALAEAALGLEDLAPALVKEIGTALLQLLLGGGLDLGALIDGIELAALDGVEEDLGSFLDALEEVIILGAAGGSLLIGVVLEDLLAVGTLDLVLGSPEAVLGKTQNSVVILLLFSDVLVKLRHCAKRMAIWITYLPVLGLALEHHGILRLADLAIILLLDLLGTLLGLDTVILGEGTLVAGTTGVGEEVRTDGLDGALGRGADLADGLEVLLGGPALGEDWERTGDNSGGHHLFFILLSMGMGRQKKIEEEKVVDVEVEACSR